MKPQRGKPPTLSWVGLSLVICSYFPGVWLNCNRRVFCCCASMSAHPFLRRFHARKYFFAGSSPSPRAYYILALLFCSVVMLWVSMLFASFLWSFFFLRPISLWRFWLLVYTHAQLIGLKNCEFFQNKICLMESVSLIALISDFR